MNLTTDAQLAEQFGLDLKKFTELRRKHQWPHVRLGRFDIRFTDDQVAQIVEMHSATQKKTAAPQTAALPGQTTRSARRSA